MLQDLRFAVRSINTHRWFSAAIIATIALGIGINTTVFTLVNAALFKDMPFPDGERLVAIASERPAVNQNRSNVSYPDFLDYRAQTSSFELFEAVVMSGATISEPGVPPEQYRLTRATTGILSIARTAPVLGRGFTVDDALSGAPPVVVIGHNMWRNRYQLSPDVIGRSIRLNGKPTTIVGVMPEGFRFPSREDLWGPLAPPDKGDLRTNRYLLVIGLLKPGVTRDAALVDLKTIAGRLENSYPEDNKGVSVRVETFNQRFNGGEIRQLFLLCLAAVAFVLLVACANVANMLLGRALTRQREMAVRAALGASRWQMVRQLLVESVVLSAAGGVIGLGLAMAGVDAFDRALHNVNKPSWVLFSMDLTVFTYFAAISVLSGILFGVAPALRSSRVDLTTALKDGGRGGSGRAGRLAGLLVVLQFSLAIVLLAGAGLMMRSFVAKQAVNGWIDKQQILTARVTLPGDRYRDREARLRFFDEASTRIGALPGVIDSAIMANPPGMGSNRRRIEVDGKLVEKAEDRTIVANVAVSPGYFKMMKLPIVRGRAIETRDGLAGGEVAVVTRQFAATFWPGEDALGKRFRFNPEQTPGPWMTVMGVADNLLQTSDESKPEPVAFLPYRQEDPTSMVLAVLTAGDASKAGSLLRAEVQALDADLALADVETIQQLTARAGWGYAVFGTLFSVFAGAGLLMAAVGLYAVMAQATGRRTREIGIRMALGATPARVLRTVMRRGVIQLGIGVALGLVGAFAATRAMTSLLFGVEPDDPLVFAAIATTMSVVGLTACWLPARRACGVEPLRALAHEDRA